VISGQDENRGRSVVDGIDARGGQAVFLAGDIADAATNRRLVDEAIQRFGGVDILVPNAGILGIGGVLDSPLEVWTRTIDVNLNAVYYLVHAAAPAMMQRTGGSIVINGSIAAYKGFPNHPAYCAGSWPSTWRRRCASTSSALARWIRRSCGIQRKPSRIPRVWCRR
jgi:NAD(P)-dependent dehydrogenase (short-subunit alcohol dehydrogenase family)